MNGSEITVAWHRSYRYPKREVSRPVDLVNSYADDVTGHALGDRGEHLVLEGFARNQFLMQGRNVRSFGGRTWTTTGHNLDFIFERDGRAYGVEVKNTLSYPPKAELDTKADLAEHLGLIPLFVCRMLPKSWINEVHRKGGFCLIIEWQLHPRTHRPLVDRLRRELELPVDTPRVLQDGTMRRFTKWHDENV